MEQLKSKEKAQINISGKYSRYVYLCDYNDLINIELKERFLKYGANRVIKLERMSTGKDAIVSSIKNISKITFEITRGCNLRCKYCVYRGDYHFERNLTKEYIDPEIAKKGLDFIFNIIKNKRKREFSIAFYGGEPLLRFSTIREIVDYAKGIFKNWELRFTMTSNGTILNDEILRFLIENKILLCISLDGPQKIHDNKRVFPDGEGTFEIVWNNIKKIAEKDGKYFSNRVRFNAVLSKELSIIDAVHFFDEEKLIKENIKFFSFVSSKDSDYFKKYPYRRDKFVRNLDTILKSVEDKIIDGSKLTLVDEYFKDNIINENRLSRNIFTSLGGACLFGSNLFIDYSGNFHFCEQINVNFLMEMFGMV